MNKATIIAEVAEAADISTAEAAEVVDTVFESIVQALKDGDRVELRRFGTFWTRKRNGRTAHIPNSERKIEVPPKLIPGFRASKSLLEVINEDSSEDIAVEANSPAIAATNP